MGRGMDGDSGGNRVEREAREDRKGERRREKRN